MARISKEKRRLLIELEEIIGKSAYNKNIKNFLSRGVEDEPGRAFRYPATFTLKDGEEKKHYFPEDLSDRELMSGRYKVGANEIAIYHALDKILNLLCDKYGFAIKEVNSNPSQRN